MKEIEYLNELREQEWIGKNKMIINNDFFISIFLDLCLLYMSLARISDKSLRESDQALYSSYLKFLIDKLIVYNDLDTNKTSLRKDLLDFFRSEIEQITFVFFS